jgi:aldehyde dehydrogenase (NAD+)
LKPSEQAASVSATFAKLIPKYFEKGVIQVVEGGVEETSQLMSQHWGKVHFTGSERVGKIIQANAAKTLTPTILELGGKAPCIIAEDCPDISIVCNRLIFGKLINCGQACVSPDFVLIHESKLEVFKKKVVETIENQFGKNQKEDAEFGRIITEGHAKRLVELIEEVETIDSNKIIYGGSKLCCAKEKFVTPTVIINPALDCRIMKEEIFGPILPVLTYSDDDDALAICKKVSTTPLTLYVFTKSQSRYEKFMSKIPSGSAIRNDTLLQLFIPDFPFGGIGTSGVGSYVGKASFDTFTHAKTSQYHVCNALAEFGGLR